MKIENYTKIIGLSHRRIDPDIWNVVVNGSPEQRRYIVEREPLYFALYYFAEFFEYQIADFQFDFYNEFKALILGVRTPAPNSWLLRLKELLWCAFRESAKTTTAKICLVWVIANAHRRYISYGSYDGDNATAALFDIRLWLQTNKKLIADYGLLYKKRKVQGELEEVQEKKKDKFITSNKVRVIAFTTQESTRGHVFGKFRPDLYVYDDIENNKTKESHAITGKIIAHLDEARTGMPDFGSVLYLGNYIRDDGSVNHIKDILEKMDDGLSHFVPVMDEKKNLLWPDKYVISKAEAAKLNETIENERLRKVSLEKKQEDLGDSVYYTEMMNEPGKSGDYYFDRDKVRAAEENIKDPIKEIGIMKLWEKYNPSHRYALGADTAEGIGGDSSATAVIDFTRNPGLVVATFDDNQITPKVFAHEIAREGRYFGECYVVPEMNNGYGTVGELIDPEGGDYQNVYIRKVKNKTTNKTQNEYGFNTNKKTKPDILSHFKEAFEDGHLEIYDKGLLEEMKYFRKSDSHRIKTEEGATRHFDKLMATALAWEGRKYARSKADDDKYISPQTKEDANKVISDLS